MSHGRMKRDFTYVDDIVEAIVRIVDHTATSNLSWNSNDPDPGSSTALYRV
nr:NAD-dependent epimerase/dehydratase family protein [Crateriforma conspicua]